MRRHIKNLLEQGGKQTGKGLQHNHVPGFLQGASDVEQIGSTILVIRRRELCYIPLLFREEAKAVPAFDLLAPQLERIGGDVFPML